MLRPSYSDLINVVNSEVKNGGEPIVQSRYSIVIATSRRARQIVENQVNTPFFDDGRKPLSIAVEEIEKQKIKIIGAEN